MTQPYGQQPGNYGQQPSGEYPQQGGYPQPNAYAQPAGYPQAPGQPSPPTGFPQAPVYPTGPSGLPQAPVEYGHSGVVSRPGTGTAAAVLAFVQAGITAIPTVLLLSALARADNNGGTGFGWAITLGQVAGVVLLIWGGIQLMTGTGRTVLLIGAAVEVVLSLSWIIWFASVSSDGLKIVQDAKSAGVVIAIVFAVMPAIALIMALGGAVTEYLNSRRAGVR